MYNMIALGKNFYDLNVVIFESVQSTVSGYAGP